MLKMTVYQYTEAPLVLEEITKIDITNEGEEIEVTYNEGRLQFTMDDVMKIEVENVSI